MGNSSLMQLPQELRLKIYTEYIDTNNKQNPWYTKQPKSSCPLLAVSKQMRRECAPLLMSTLTLHLDGWLQQPKASWSLDFRAATQEPWTHRTYHPILNYTNPQSIPQRKEWQNFRESELATRYLQHVKSLHLHVECDYHFSGLEFHVTFSPNCAPRILTFTEVKAVVNKSVQSDVEARLARWKDGDAVACSVEWIEAFAQDMKALRQEIKEKHGDPFVRALPHPIRGAVHHCRGRICKNEF